MGISHWFVGMVGLFGGMVIASGLVALLIGLNIIPRYAGITHTAHHMLLYENCAMAGAFLGNLFTLYDWNLPLGRWLFSIGSWQLTFGNVTAGVYGLFGGIFLGSWIIALTEILDIVPIMARRAGMVKGIGLLIISTAVGKTLWSLLFFYKGW